MTAIRVQNGFAAGKEKYVDMEMQQPFATGIIDPDWPYTIAPGVADISNATGSGKLGGFTRNRDTSKNKYLQEKPMSIEELKKLPIGDLVGGYLLMWTVSPFLLNGKSLDLMRAWGFEPSSMVTWAKYDLQNSHGYGGVGFWFLGNAEYCVVGKKPGWPSIRTGRSSLLIEESIIVAPKGRHSAKPDAIHELCEERFPGPHVEIFGRRNRRGWTVLGNEAPNDGKDIVVSLAKQIKKGRRT